MSDGFVGQQGLSSSGGEFNAIRFVAWQLLGLVGTVKLVKVIAVHGAGGIAVAGTVDVQPLVNQIDGQGNSTPHGTVFSLPYFRLQGGVNAIIIDPVAGDIGLAVIADRDISAVKASKKQSNPGSYRRFDTADGIYIGGILNAVPTQWIAFLETGISIGDVNNNSIVTGPAGISLNGVLIDLSGNISTPENITAGQGGPDSVALQTHKHGDVQTGSGESGAPVAGT